MKKIRESIHKHLQPISQTRLISLQGTRFHMESRKMVLVNLSVQGINGETNTENRLTDTVRRKWERMRCMERRHGNLHYHV